MKDQPVAAEPTSPGARQTKASDVLLLLGVVALAFAVAFGIFALILETVKPTPMADWALAKGILAIPYGFPAGKAPANLWDLSQSLPFAFSWTINKIAVGVSVVLYFLFIFSGIVPFLGLVGVLVYLSWRLYFRARIGGGSMPAPRSRLERGE